MSNLKWVSKVAAATLVVPAILTTTAYAKTATPTSAWNQVLQNTQKAAYMQVQNQEVVTVTTSGLKLQVTISMSIKQERHANNISALSKVTETMPGTKVDVQLYQKNQDLYASSSQSPKWQLIEHSKSDLTQQVLNAGMYTHVAVKKTANGQTFTMQMDPKQLASFVQGFLGQLNLSGSNNSQSAMAAKLLKTAKVSVSANSQKLGGVERISKQTVDVDIHTSMQQLQGGTSSNTGTDGGSVTDSVYGSNGSSGSAGNASVEIKVHETTNFAYNKLTVAAPKNLPKK